MDKINIYLSFLSPVKEYNGVIDKKTYPQLLADGLGETHTTNESGIRYVQSQLKDCRKGIDGFIFLVSEQVKTGTVSINGLAGPGSDLEKITHYDYITRRLETVTGLGRVALSDRIRPIPYNVEPGRDISVQVVLDSAEALFEFQRQYADQKEGKLPDIDLYLDLTGGFRDANMILLIISRIVEYHPSITVKNIVYSNLQDDGGKVQSIVGAYHLLDLVSGVHEFSLNGSVNGLDNYFSSVPEEARDPVVSNLLEAMHFFSDCILLCRSGEFFESIKELKAALDKFTKYVNDTGRDLMDVSTRLLSSLIPTITEKYSALFSAVNGDEIDDFKIFRWCVENQCLQQAITLITERMPERLVSIKPDRETLMFVSEEKVVEMKNEFAGRKETNNDFSCWLLFEKNDTGRAKLNLGNLQAKFRKIFFSGILSEAWMDDEKFEVGLEKFKRSCRELEERSRYDVVLDWDLVIPRVLEFRKFYKNASFPISEEILAEGSCGVIAGNFVKFPEFRTLPPRKFLGRFGSKQFVDFDKIDPFEFLRIKTEIPTGNYPSIAYLLDSGILKTELDPEKVKSVLMLYYEIKDERNFINHAHRVKQRITFNELKAKMGNLTEFAEQLFSEKR